MKGRKLVAKRVQGVQCTRALGCQGLTDTDKKMEQVNQTIVYWKLHIEFGFFSFYKAEILMFKRTN